MDEYALIALNKSEHGLILLNVPEFCWKYPNKLFWLCQDSDYDNVRACQTLPNLVKIFLDIKENTSNHLMLI